jgi:hypothetical protein
MAGNEHAPHPEMRQHGEDTCPRCPGTDFETLGRKMVSRLLARKEACPPEHLT